MKTLEYDSDIINTRLCDLRSVTTEDEAMMLDIISRTRRDYALSFKERGNITGFLERLTTGYLLETGLDINTPEYGKTKNGRPFIIDADFDFSLSHSGNYAVCSITKKGALSRKTGKMLYVGSDIEDLSLNRKSGSIERIVKRYFTVQEKQLFYESNTGHSLRTFLDIWTKKEAAAKAADIPIVHMLDHDLSEYTFETTITDDYILTICLL